MASDNDFLIRLRSVQDVEDFTKLSTGKIYPVFLDDGRHRVNGKSFMEMFCLILTGPLRVTAECSIDELNQLRMEAERFLEI